MIRKKCWVNCSEKIAKENFRRLKFMHLNKKLTPAVISYESIAYQYMASAVLEDASWLILRNIYGFFLHFTAYLSLWTV